MGFKIKNKRLTYKTKAESIASQHNRTVRKLRNKSRRYGFKLD